MPLNNVSPSIVYLAIGVGVLVFFFMVFVAALKRYKRCNADQVMVISGKVGAGQSAKCIHGGAAFVWPVIQDFYFLSLTPMSVEVDLKGALSKQNIRINAPASFTIGISTEPAVMQAAAERLLGLPEEAIHSMAEEIIMGQMRQVIASLTIEEINSDREKLIENVAKSVSTELEKIGLHLINVNIRDVTDQGGYIEALGQEAAAQAVNEAKIKVSQATRNGSIGSAEAERDRTISVSAAAASGKQGENIAQITIADSDAERRRRQATATQVAETAERIAKADTEKDSYAAKEAAERARAVLAQATLNADVIVPAEVTRQKIAVDAAADADKQSILAEGQGRAIISVQEAEARGIRAKLEARAAGFKTLVDAAGGDAKAALQLLMIDILPSLVDAQVEAIKNIQIDKITVWDSGSSDKNGNNGLAGFLRNLGGALPPLHELAKQAGVELPEILGKPIEAESDPVKVHVPAAVAPASATTKA
jgi:flotillin